MNEITQKMLSEVEKMLSDYNEPDADLLPLYESGLLSVREKDVNFDQLKQFEDYLRNKASDEWAEKNKNMPLSVIYQNMSKYCR